MWYNQNVSEKETWRNTQVRLKGPVLKTGRSATARGFESLFLRHLSCLYNIAGWSSLVARRAHNPEVVGSNPSPATILVPWCSGYHVCLSRRRSRVRFSSEPPFGFIAQSVEQRTENPRVGGSIPPETTRGKINLNLYSGFLLFKKRFKECDNYVGK